MLKSTLAFALTLVAAVPALAQNLPPYKAGFPLTLAGQGGVSNKPALADLKIPGDSVGVRSIVWVGNNGNLHVVHRTATPTIWAEAPGFPIAVAAPSGSAADSGFRSSVAVGDLTGDGIPELVVGYGPLNNTVPGGVKAFRNTGGAPLWSRTSQDVGVPNGGVPDPVVGTPAIGDVDGDGQNDVVWGAIDHRVYFVNGSTGLDKPNWPRFMNDTVLSSPVLHDMDGDGRLEIIVGVDANANATFGTPEGGCLHVMPGAQPAIGGGQGYPVDLPGFPKCVNQVIYSDPVVGDIDGDGRPDIVHGTGNFFPGRTKAVYAYKCDGTPVAAGWPVLLAGEVLLGTSLALANVDTSTPALEVVLSVDSSPPAPLVYVIRGDGTVMPGFPKAPKSFDGGSFNAGSPVVADVLGANTALEILVPTNTDIAIFDTAGTQLTNPPVSGAFSFYTATTLTNVGVADLDPGDGKIEVVAISAAPFPAATDTVIHVWNPVNRATAPPWGQYRQNERRTGVAPGTGPCRSYGACPAAPASPRFNTITPCRVVDTRGGAVPIGGPALASNSLRDFVLRGKCNVPATAKALSLNLTVVSPGGEGFVQFAPSCLMGASSTINFGPAQTRANNAVLPLGDADGVLTAKAFVTGGGSVHLLIDVNGYFE